MSRSLGAAGRSRHLAFPKVLTPLPPAPLLGSGEPRKELGKGTAAGTARGGRVPAPLHSQRAPSRTIAGTSEQEQERKDPPGRADKPQEIAASFEGHPAIPQDRGRGGGGTQNPTQPHANDTGAYILLLAVTSRLVLEAGPAAFLLQWTRGLAGSAVLLAALGAQEVTRFGGNGERAGGVDLPAEPLVQ